MIKLKELLSETSISMGQVHSNPYARSFKSPKEIESVSESMDDLVIKRGLELSLKGAGFKVKKFKQKKPGYNEIWAGEFSTKNALLPFSYSKYGDVFFNTRKGSKNIGKLNSSRLLDWLKSIKSNNKWAESVDEAITSKGWNQSKKFIKILDREVKNIKKYHNQQNDEDFFEVIDYMQLQLNTLKRDMKKFNESVNEKVARPMSYRLRKAQDEIEYMIKQGPLEDEGVYDKPVNAMKLLQTAQKALGKIK